MDDDNEFDRLFSKMFGLGAFFAVLIALLLIAVTSTGIYLAIKNWG